MNWPFPSISANRPPAPRAHGAPALPLLARESMAFAYMRTAAAFGGAIPIDIDGTGQQVVVLPGFMASDHTTARLRRSLEAAGFECHGWGLGRNMGVTEDIFDRLDTRLDMLGLDEPIKLVGWSLGGLIAREYAKRAPHRISRVITLGSPFSGNPRANNAWRVYEFVAGYKVDAPPVDAVLGEKPPVETHAFWSSRDGVVAPSAARGLPHESDRQVELDCTHMAFVARPAAIRAVAAALI